MAKDELSYELQQPYNLQSLNDELWQIKHRIFADEIRVLILSLSQVDILAEDEVKQLLKTAKILRIMGRTVTITSIQPAIAKLMNEVDVSFEIGDSQDSFVEL